MHVWNVLHSARWNTGRKKSPFWHHRTNLSGYIFATKACIDNRKKKLVKQQYLLQMSLHYGELRPTNGWDRLACLEHPIIFQRYCVLASLLHGSHSSSGRQPNFAALNRGRHLCSAGRPSRWALGHIIVTQLFWMAESCLEVRFTQLLVIAIFSTNISSGSAAMRLKCGGTFNYCFTINVVRSLFVKKYENRLAFGKVRAKNRVPTFFGTLV